MQINLRIVQSSKIDLYTGKDVLDLLSNEAFNTEWDALYNTCSWSTVFQSRPFVNTWYKTYHHIFLPIVIISRKAGQLTGLLTMTKDDSGQICGAGNDMSEYQVWLATAANSEHFIKSALQAIHRRFPNTRVLLKYIPDKVPVSWIKEDAFFKSRCFLIPFQQPLIKIDSERITRELRKKNRKEKVNRLKRIGEITFERITDSHQFASILDELILQFEFRKMAMHNTSLFLSDQVRKSFILSLFEQSLLHVTVLKVNGEIIASNVGTAGKDCIHLQGLNTHAPSFAKYSPGILHFLMLCNNLADEGIAVFDLTPGENSYKDALATDYSISYKFCFGSPLHRLANQWKFSFIQKIKKGVSIFDLQVSRWEELKSRFLFFTDKVRHARKQKLHVVVKSIMGLIGGSNKTCNYEIHSSEYANRLDSLPIHKNSLGDLLQFDAEGTWMTRWEFLAAAMHRFSVGHTAYTWSESERLLACVWVKLDSAVGKEATQNNTPLPPSTVLLEGFYCHPQGQERYPAFLQTVAAALTGSSKKAVLYAGTTSQDKAFRQTLESIGFQKATPY